MTKKILLEDALILKGIKLAQAIVRILPLALSLGIIRRIGSLIYLGSKRGRIAYKNVRLAFASELAPARMRVIARHSIENLAVSAVDLLSIPKMDSNYLDRHIRVIGTERFEQDLKAGRGIIFLTAHFGSWELLNITAGILKYPMLVLARLQKHPRSDAFLNGLRMSKGSRVVAKGMPIREILKALKNGEIVGILGDQDGGKNGTFVKFFGRMTSFAPGAAAFALRSQARIYPVFISREKGLSHRIEVDAPLAWPPEGFSEEEKRAYLVQQFADVLEAKIRKEPDQWLWAHRKWKSSPDRSVVILSDAKTGHLRQSLALGESIRALRNGGSASSGEVRQHVIEIIYRNGFRKNLLKFAVQLFGKRLPGGTNLMKWALTSESYGKLIGTYADVVISAGASLAAVNVLTARENGARSVHFMRPGIDSKLFDALIVPGHDGPKQQPNIFITDGMVSSFGLKDLALATDRLLQEQPILRGGNKRIGLLVGGDTAQFKFERDVFEKNLEEIEAARSELGAHLLATSSRRTPDWADASLERFFSDATRCPFLVLPKRANPEGSMAAILGASDILLTTGESMSMISEAVSTGKKVIVFTPSRRARLKKKYQRLLNEWSRAGRVVLAPRGALGGIIQKELNAAGTDKRQPLSVTNEEVLLRVAAKVCG